MEKAKLQITVPIMTFTINRFHIKKKYQVLPGNINQEMVQKNPT